MQLLQHMIQMQPDFLEPTSVVSTNTMHCGNIVSFCTSAIHEVCEWAPIQANSDLH
jgi:hypothetical protein